MAGFQAEESYRHRFLKSRAKTCVHGGKVVGIQQPLWNKAYMKAVSSLKDVSGESIPVPFSI